MGLNTDLRRQIHEEMLRYRRFPENLFVGDGWRAEALRVAFTWVSKPRP